MKELVFQQREKKKIKEISNNNFKLFKMPKLK